MKNTCKVREQSKTEDKRQKSENEIKQEWIVK
jgi:hypothetical protein